jgi:hypothetical protein
MNENENESAENGAEQQIIFTAEFDGPNSTRFSMQGNINPWQMAALASHLRAESDFMIEQSIVERKMREAHEAQQMARVQSAIRGKLL